METSHELKGYYPIIAGRLNCQRRNFVQIIILKYVPLFETISKTCVGFYVSLGAGLTIK